MRQERKMWSASTAGPDLKVVINPSGGVPMAGAYCDASCQYLFYETSKDGEMASTCTLFDLPLSRSNVRCSACVSLVGTDEVAQVVTGVEVAAPAEPVVPPEPPAPPERVIATIATLNIDMDLDEDTGDKPWLK